MPHKPRKLTVAEGQTPPGELGVVDSDRKLCTAAILGQLSGICRPEASNGWLRAFCKVVIDRALPQGEW